MRIVSLLPSATETLWALCLADNIVGISHACDYPPEICDRPKVTVSLLSDDLPRDELHRRVQENASMGRSLYSVDVQKLADLEPDVVVTQEQCSVCAVGRRDVEAALRAKGVRAAVISLSAARFGEVFQDIVRLGQVTGTLEMAAELISVMRCRIESVRRKTAGARRPRVFCLSWFKPVMAASHWLTEMIRLSGGNDGLGTADGSSRPQLPEALQRYSPEVILLMPCGLSLERTIAEWYSADVQSVCANLPATRNGRVFAVQGSMFHRPGPRLADAIEMLGSLLHPLRIRRLYGDSLVQGVA